MKPPTDEPWGMRELGLRSPDGHRFMTTEPVARHTIEAILDAGRWASTAGNRHLQRFVVTDHPGTLRVLRMLSPGMIQRPAAAITICTDRTAATDYGFPPNAAGLDRKSTRLNSSH